MAGYPLLREPPPAGLITLATWGGEINRAPRYIANFWAKLEGWPDPAGQLPGRGRRGGGPGELVYSRAGLEAFRAARPELWPERNRRLVQTGLDPDTRVTLGRFAAIAEWSRKTVTQYRDSPGFPPAGQDDRYRLQDLVDFFNHGRPGKRGPARRAKADRT